MKPYLSFLLAVLMLLASGAEFAQARKLPRLFDLKKTKTRQTVHTAPIRKKLKLPKVGIPARIKTLAQPSKLVPAENAPIRSSVLAMREEMQSMYGEPPFTASSFVIEEEFEGKKYLWGVTAEHIAALMNGYPTVIWAGVPFPVEFSARGTSGMADLALFPLNNLADDVTPLKLAKKTPVPGEETYSFGFFNNNFYLVPNRTVREVTPNRIITSLEFKTAARGGACGGPVLNAKGEVTGVHVGSSDSQKTSFVVPASEIKRLLYAYRHGGKAPKKLVFNGTEIGTININEHIDRIYTRTNGLFTEEFTAHHREKEIDYNHLETLIKDKNPDNLQIFITHKPFSSDGEDDMGYVIRITYDVRNQKIFRDRLPGAPYNRGTKPRRPTRKPLQLL